MAKLRARMQRVVVADDNPAMTAALKVVLQIWGWDVLVAHDGMTAVEAIRASRPALALIDIGLPDLDGLEVARVLHAQGAAPRLMIALSGYGEERDLLASRQAGFDRHLVKPVDPEVLRRTIMPVASQGRGRARRYGAAPTAPVSRSPIRRGAVRDSWIGARRRGFIRRATMRLRQTAAAKAYEVGKRSAPIRLAPMRAPRSSSSGRLAAAIAHEIRTPLAVALMYLRLVEQEAGPLVKESLRDGLSQARDEVARLDRLLANLVDLHRHGHVMIRPGLVDAGRVVSDAVRRTSWELGVAQVNVELGAADLLDWWDASAVDQIVHNLLSNAVQYADGRPCSVKVDRAAGALRVRVTDSGGGIPAARTRACFAGGSAAQARASGLGTGSGSFASWPEAHGGSATVESRKGAGSTFTVRLAPQRP